MSEAVQGLLGAIALAKVLSALANMFVDALRFGTDDLRLLLGAPLQLSAVAVLAGYLPARRSAQVDPLKALREEYCFGPFVPASPVWPSHELDIEWRPKGSGELG